MVNGLPFATRSERVRAVVEEVLERREYAGLSPSLWDRMVAGAQEWLGGLLSAVMGARGGALAASLLLVGAAVAVAGLVGVGLLRLRGDRVREAAAGADVHRPAVDWRAEARDHERAGRWRDALRCRYRALIADLAADGVLQEVPGRTAGEYLEAVRTARPSSAQAMAAVTATFQAAWYGHERVDAEALATLEEQAARARA